MGRKTIVVCGATSSGSISGRHRKIEPATPNLGETHYGERSGLNPVSIFIEPLHLADRGDSTAKGLRYVGSKGAYVTVRVNTASLPFYNRPGKPFALHKAVSSITSAGTAKSWPGLVIEAGARLPDRLYIIRKSKQAIHCAQARVHRTAARQGKPCTLEYAKYVMLFTTFPASGFTVQEVLQWYRIRWQVVVGLQTIEVTGATGPSAKIR